MPVRNSLSLRGEVADRVAKKEAKRLEKLARSAVKAVVPQAAAASSSARKEKKEKEKEKEKEKKEVAPAEKWVNTTAKGEKKGRSLSRCPYIPNK